MSIDRKGNVLIKGVAFKVTHEKKGKVKLDPVPVQIWWLKSEGGKATVPYKGMTWPGEDHVSIIYADENGLDKYSEMIDSISSKKPILIGVQVKGQPDAKVFSGVVKLTEGELDSFLKCNLEIANKLTEQSIQ